jgi:hypothetical protein
MFGRCNHEPFDGGGVPSRSIAAPWENLAIEPEIGDEIGFQLYVNDTDGADDRFRVTWYPCAGTHADPTAMHRLRLASKPGPKDTAAKK